jgi:hypothetical protein
MLINNLLTSDYIRFFSLARYALSEALKMSGVGEGDCVLIPEYICRDIIASINVNNAHTVYYKVGEDLTPLEHYQVWPKAKVVLAVNYFGFPQNLSPFIQYSELTKAVIIEDNAHGFLSKDKNMQWLGMRADIGIFSFRKTFCLSDGAALVINKSQTNIPIKVQLSFTGKGFNPTIGIKCKIKKIPFIGVYLWIIFVILVRFFRKLRTGHAIPTMAKFNQHSIPYNENPHRALLNQLKQCGYNEKSEVNRRRKLYHKISIMAHKKGIVPIFDHLPAATVPYGFPFRATEREAMLFSRSIKWLGFDLLKWPDLPHGIPESDNYKNIWIVNFL